MSLMDSGGRDITINISTGTIVKIILFVLLIGLLFFLRDLVLIVLTAIVIASAIEPATKWFMKYKVPRVAGVLLVYIIVSVLLFGIFYLFIPPLLEEASGLFAILPQYLNTLVDSNPLTDGVSKTSEAVVEGVRAFSPQDLINDLRSAISNVSEGFVRTVSAVFGGILSLILIIVFSFYFAVQERGIEDFLRVITPVKQQAYVVDLWRRTQRKIGLWMQGQLVLALIIGVLTYLGLTVFGVPYALLLALLAAMFEIIPIFGPILAAIPAVAVALVDGGASLGFLVVGLYLIIQQFENHLIYPLVVKKVVGVSPLLVILALLIGIKVAGFLGVILSVPVAAALQEFVSDVQKNKKASLEKKKA